MEAQTNERTNKNRVNDGEETVHEKQKIKRLKSSLNKFVRLRMSRGSPTIVSELMSFSGSMK